MQVVTDPAWESMEQICRNPGDRPKVWVERDYAGPGGHLRYTIYGMPSLGYNCTLVQQPYYVHEGKLKQWIADRDAFLSQVPGETLIISPSGKYVGTVADAVGYCTDVTDPIERISGYDR